MTKDQLVRLLRDPSQIDEQDFVGLEKLHAEFPYAYPLSLLKLLHLKAQDSYMYQSALSQTALLSPDREKLWKWVEGEDSEVSIENAAEKSAVQNSKSVDRPIVGPTPVPTPEPSPEPDLTSVSESTNEAIQEPVLETNTEAEIPQDEVTEEIDTAPVVEAPTTEPAKPLDDTPPKKLGDDLSHLPEKVRAVIERSRSIQRKIHDAEEIEPKVSEEETPDIGVEEVEVTTLESPPSNAADEVGLEILEEEAEFLSFTPQESVQSTEGREEENEEGEEEREEETIEAVEKELENTPSSEAQPIEVTDADGKHSFSVWLQMTKGEDVQEIEEAAEDQDQKQYLSEDLGDKTVENTESQEKEKLASPEPKTLDEKMELIDQFIRKPPRFKPNKKNQNTLDMSKISEQSDSSIITETLAQVYRQQKHYDKAIEAYEILRLKYPEKSGLFADRILEIKKLKENK